MIKKLLFAVVCASLLQSCVSIKKLPTDLPKSKLLVELLPTNMEKVEGKKGMDKLTNFMVNYTNKRNSKLNIKTTNSFKKYPFDYKLVTKEEVGDNMDAKKTTYYMRNGTLRTTTTYSTSSTGTTSKKSEKTDVVLENLTKNRKSTIATIKLGVAGLSPHFVKRAIKMQKAKKKK